LSEVAENIIQDISQFNYVKICH